MANRLEPTEATPVRVAVVGASGFVGRAVVSAFSELGVVVRAVPAPRVTGGKGDVTDPERFLRRRRAEVESLATSFEAHDVVVNAAGVADAASTSLETLLGANTILPRLIDEAARAAGVGRFVHISSAAVQGRREVLDETDDVAPFSAYSQSKAWGEQLLRGRTGVVVFRPTSVHGSDRSVTLSVQRVAASSLASVAGAGDRPTPQVLVENVGSAVTFVALSRAHPPPVVLQPWEGLTTAELVRVLGDREPRHLPWWLARSVLRLCQGVPHSGVRANARRLEMLWCGQAQVTGWLTGAGWRPPAAREAWNALAARAREVRRAESR